VSAFNGFSLQALDFYEDLEANNTRTFWAEHKNLYESQVRDPMRALLAELAGDFGEGTVFRPHRDVRFSKDKSPYKTHQGGFAELNPGTGFYVQLDASGLMAGGGFHAHSSDQIERYRVAVDTTASGEDLAALVSALSTDGFDIGGERLKTRPRGYPEDHPRIELLRHKTLTASKSFGAPPWLSSREALEHVRAAWEALRPLNAWIGQHVGPPDAPARRR
jgi:uncharacterized protein (TIGR02453 family)